MTPSSDGWPSFSTGGCWPDARYPTLKHTEAKTSKTDFLLKVFMECSWSCAPPFRLPSVKEG
jgi:hypothetical protein